MEITIRQIKNELKRSCEQGNPTSFIPYLLSPKVKTDMPNKMRFYRFFKRMIYCSKNRSFGEWNLRIEEYIWSEEEDVLAYNFYDQVHKIERLTIIVKESNDEIYLEIMPF